MAGRLRGPMEAVDCWSSGRRTSTANPTLEIRHSRRACRQQRVDLVHKLLDYDCNRRPSAFAILEGEALMEITLRLEEEKRKKVEEYEKLKRAGSGREK